MQDTPPRAPHRQRRSLLFFARASGCPLGLVATISTVLVLATLFSESRAARIGLNNGMTLEGDTGRIGTVVASAAQSKNSEPGGEQIILIDNNLTRTYVPFSQVSDVVENVDDRPIKFPIPHQPVSMGGNRLGTLGRMEILEDWDKFGRRTVQLSIKEGKASVVQGITLITPKYFRVETLSGGRRLLLDQRYATSNLPTPLLREILYQAFDRKSANDRLRIYRFFLQSDRYADASAELDGIIKDFSKLDLSQERQTIRNRKAESGLREIKYRRSAGQHQLARRALESFPVEDIAGVTLIEVREILDKYSDIEQRTDTLSQKLMEHRDLVTQPDARERVKPIVDEIYNEVNSHTLQRLTAYRQLADDPGTSVNEKIALAVSGWLVGPDNATDNLPVALSLVEVRKLVQAYLTEDLKMRRSALIGEINSQEAGVPRLVAEILGQMKPPLPVPEPFENIDGLYRLTVPAGEGLADVSYLVQLPPEYDPYRRYPTVVTLHGSGTTAPLQIDWWAGGLDKSGNRRGQGARHGYIIIAPEWTTVRQRQYQYSSREHAAVLNSLRDASRRFSIDVDKVFLSGHSMGGDAAWDIGLSHPDQWAGVIPIVATADSNHFNYTALYWRNAKHVPLYFIGGELDSGNMPKNAHQFDRYLRYRDIDAIIVNYQGRGHENFSDEILNVFDWMNRQRREFFPTKFQCSTIRSWDNYFWWVEMNDIAENQVVDPHHWPQKRQPQRLRALTVSGTINAVKDMTNIRVASGNNPTTVWLSPGLVDFETNIRIHCDGFRAVNGPSPSVAVMLEDARTRGDRIHPFWARIDLPLKD
ncbi:MAG: peptidase [Pirellulales bacterium]